MKEEYLANILEMLKNKKISTDLFEEANKLDGEEQEKLTEIICSERIEELNLIPSKQLTIHEKDLKKIGEEEIKYFLKHKTCLILKNIKTQIKLKGIIIHQLYIEDCSNIIIEECKIGNLIMKYCSEIYSV